MAEQPTVRRDTQIPVQLRRDASTTTAHPGAMLEFVTTESVLIGKGVVVPKGAQVLGRIEQVRSGSLMTGAALRVSLQSLQWDHWSVPLNAVVMGIEPSGGYLHRGISGRRTMLEHIGVQSHAGPRAFVDFQSDRGDFTLRHGVRLLLLQVDPERDPLMFAESPVLEIQAPGK